MRAASRSSRSRRSVASASAPISGPLRARAARARTLVGDEVDLHLGVGRDDGADVAALDHGVPLAGELALALAHHVAHLLVAGDDGTSGRSRDLRIAAVTSLPSIETRAAASNVTGLLARERAERGLRRSSSSPRSSASHVSARYIAPVSR